MIPPSGSLQSKITALIPPAFDPLFPHHVIFLTNQIKKFHGNLESHLCTYLNPKSASLYTTLIYAIPPSLLIQALPNTYTAVLSLVGGAYLWSCREEIISNEAKVNLLHSIAIGFFASLVTAKFSENSLLKLPLDMTCLTASLILANQLEKKEKSNI